MRLTTAAWILVGVIGATECARAAAPATPEGAQAIKTELARYLGAPPLTVTAAGDAYRIDIDLKAALASLERFGVTLDPVTYSMNAAPQDDGTWRVTSGTLPLITVKAGGQTTSVVANNQSFDGIFDPRIPAFIRSTNHYDSLNIGTVANQDGKGVGLVQTRTLQNGTQTVTASPAGDGIVDVTLAQGNSTYAQDIAIDAAKGVQHIAIKSGPTKDAFTISKLPIRALLDLWSFLVAHPSAPELKTNEAELKTRLRHVLPLFGRMTQDAALEQVSVTTPVGPVAARALATHLDLTGLTNAGTLDVGLKADDLVLHNALLPAWAPALVPTGFDLQDTLSGFRLDKAADAVIDGFDLGKPDPFSPEAKAKVQDSLGTKDTLVVTLGQNRITTPTLEARFSGEVRMAGPTPSFTVALHATGLDKALTAIRTAAAGDASAAQAAAVLALIKGYGKAEGNDAFAWDMAGDGTGAITVNGAPLPMGPGK